MSEVLNCTRFENISKRDLNNQAFEKYLSKCKESESIYGCWYDEIDKVFFGPAEDYQNTKPYDCLYLVQKDKFLNNARHGLPHYVGLANSGYNPGELVANGEIIYESTEFTRSVKGKTVLIVGAGPSSNLVDVLKESEKYDQVWVCNDFIKHKKIKNIVPTLFYLSNEVYLKKEPIHLLKSNPQIVSAMDINVRRDPSLMSSIKNINAHNNFTFSLRSFTSSGVMPRLITLATLLGAATVGFVGLDGYAKEHYLKGEYESAFEGSTKKIANSKFNYRSQCREFILFWDYVMNMSGMNTKFVNYGKVYKHNISKHILNSIEKGSK